jgi:hypothetical protein
MNHEPRRSKRNRPVQSTLPEALSGRERGPTQIRREQLSYSRAMTVLRSIVLFVLAALAEIGP